MPLPLKLGISLMLFLVAIFIVRTYDAQRNNVRETEMTCPKGEILLLDMRRDFVCVPGSAPTPKS